MRTAKAILCGLLGLIILALSYLALIWLGPLLTALIYGAAALATAEQRKLMFTGPLCAIAILALIVFFHQEFGYQFLPTSSALGPVSKSTPRSEWASASGRLKPGVKLYIASDTASQRRRPMGEVVTHDDAHLFDDGTTRRGVQILEYQFNTRVWVPEAAAGKIYVVRADDPALQ
jgi:hypothetical protein